ncbi:MAG: hypothetical protein IIW86_03160, partial [Clostridia bacterium]|nr:hypothetical protein [Clostridia bacterium]
MKNSVYQKQRKQYHGNHSGIPRRCLFQFLPNHGSKQIISRSDSKEKFQIGIQINDDAFQGLILIDHIARQAYSNKNQKRNTHPKLLFAGMAFTYYHNIIQAEARTNQRSEFVNIGKGIPHFFQWT